MANLLSDSRSWTPARATPTSPAPDARDKLSDIQDWSLATWLHWVLRMAMLWCFIGHGSFGLIGKAAWLPYYHVFGIGDSMARDTMPIVGAVDIAIGIVTLFRPMRAVLLYAVVWTFFTALLRPLAGQGLWQEVAERGGNFGIPIAFLVLVGVGNRSVRSWFEFARPRPVTFDLARTLSWTLRIAIALLLIGHGGFGITNMHHKDWVGYLGVLGFSPDTVHSMNLIPMIAWFEVALGLAVLVKPFRGLILFVFVWKLGFELLRPISGEPIGELIERAGDFFLPIALLLVQGVLARRDVEEPHPLATASPRVSTAGTAPFRDPLAVTWAAATHDSNGHAPRHLNGWTNGSSPERPPAARPVATAAAGAVRAPVLPADPDDPEVVQAAAALAARMAARRAVPSR